jgi:2-polyprenyl-6-methoxyphenol hydroxylase-like FAD-dependent oxidoreductase
MKVLVVGAGLSGMVLATALKRTASAVELIELHPAWQVLGRR